MNSPYRLGIDLGGTKIEGVILDPDNKQIFRERLPTEQEKGYQHILSQIKHIYDWMKESIKDKSFTFGIGTPGSLSKTTGLLRNSNTLCLNGQPLKTDLEKILEKPMTLENDANCLVIAEALLGAGKGKDLVFGVIMGTGCGGGISYKGELISGAMSIAGEWGHHTIDPNGPSCWCGKKGCVETLISGGGLEKLWKLANQNELRLKEIVELSRKGDVTAKSFMNAFYRNYGRALSNIINILDPDIIILAGGVSNIDELYSEGYEEVKKNIFCDTFTTPIVKHSLGDSAGVLGAALIGI